MSTSEYVEEFQNCLRLVKESDSPCDVDDFYPDALMWIRAAGSVEKFLFIMSKLLGAKLTAVYFDNLEGGLSWEFKCAFRLFHAKHFQNVPEIVRAFLEENGA